MQDTLDQTAQNLTRLVEIFNTFRGCVVAFSGGVDSAVVASIAHRVLGNQALAVTAVSPSLAENQKNDAIQVASQIGIRHRLIVTHELQRPEYVANGSDRCFHCKSELYDALSAISQQENLFTILNGSNQDDLGDHRPGLLAAASAGVRSPLSEAGLSKDSVRSLALHLGLFIWDKPASPCLSSRIAYGEPVTVARLQAIEKAEAFLMSLGFPLVRVRYHAGDMARIEIPSDSISLLTRSETRLAVLQILHRAGFRYITLDLDGFRSGSLNEVLSFSCETTGPDKSDRDKPATFSRNLPQLPILS